MSSPIPRNGTGAGLRNQYAAPSTTTTTSAILVDFLFSSARIGSPGAVLCPRPILTSRRQAAECPCSSTHESRPDFNAVRRHWFVRRRECYVACRRNEGKQLAPERLDLIRLAALVASIAAALPANADGLDAGATDR